MDIQDIVNNKVAQMVSDGVIQQAIEDSVERALAAAVSDQFKSYGTFSKELDRVFKEGFQVNLKDLDLSSYAEQMGVLVKTKMADVWRSAALEKFNSEIDKIIAPAPSEITLTELVDQLMELARESCDYDHEEEHAEIDIKTSKYSPNSVHIKIKLGGYKDDINLYLVEGKIRISHRQSYNPTAFDPHEALIFKLYAAGTLITGVNKFDAYEVDTHLREY